MLEERERVKKEIRLLEEENRHTLLAELAKKRQKYLYLQANIEKMSYFNAHQQIVAPMAGHINKIFIHTEGGVVTPSERLLTLVPANSPLVVKALVENKDIGFVEAGMAAAIKVDTFSFQKYGILGGLVAQVGKDSVEDEKLGLIYEVQVTPLKTSMMIEGIDTPINAGMSVTAEIKVGRRRIIEFFIYPLIKSLYEGMSVR